MNLTNQPASNGTRNSAKRKKIAMKIPWLHPSVTTNNKNPIAKAAPDKNPNQ